MWVHKKSGGTYEAVSMNGLMQVDQVWVEAVIYNGVSTPSRKTFVRSKEDFLEKFVEVKQPYTGVRG